MQLFSIITRFLIFYLFLEQQISIIIRMISEVKCDTEDWSNNAENSAFFITVIHDIIS